MPWRLINDCSAIDTDLITCAEYQLFIDETETNRQPLHWKNERFALGTAKQPITGIKPQDALAFCDWLNKQEAGSGFKYRLPTLSEAHQSLIPSSSIGYWCTDGENFVLEGIGKTQWENWQDQYQQLLELSCVRDLVEALIFGLESIFELDINLILLIDLISSLSRQYPSTNNRVRARNHSLKRIREQVRKQGHDLLEELSRVEQWYIELEQGFILDQNQVFERLRELAAQLEHNLVFDSDVVLDLDLVRDIDLGFRGELTMDLDLAHYLATYRDQLLLKTRNFASLLTLDLARELTESLEPSQDFTRAVSGIKDIDLKLVNNLTSELDGAWALNRPLYRHKNKEIELAFDCLEYFKKYDNYHVLRYSLLLISACWHWLCDFDYSLIDLPNKKAKQLQQDYLQQKEQVLNIYSSFLLLAQRQEGKMPAWEGIRLVRVRK